MMNPGKTPEWQQQLNKQVGVYGVLIVLDLVLGSGIALCISWAFIGTARDQAPYTHSAELLLISY